MPSPQFNYDHLRAYALGYYDGRAHGSEATYPQHDTPELVSLYRRGYDAGVADFCEHDIEM